MKKSIALLLIFISLLSLFSCNNAGNTTKAPDTESNPICEHIPDALGTEQYTVGDDSKLPFVPLLETNEIAMELYEAAIKGEICVFDKHLGALKLEECRFPSDQLRLGECEILYKAILDMDQDGINEYVIQSEAKDHIVLHYDNGTVYSHCFDSSSFYHLNTDGSFYWIDPDESENRSRGLNQISFDGSSLNIKEVYKISFPYEDYYENNIFYIDGKQITSKEFSDYFASNIRTGVIFSPLDISCEYPISSEKACELASNYWRIENGMSEGATGTTILYRIVVLEKPNGDTPSYHIRCQMEGYRNHIPDSWYSLPPKNVIAYKELLIDAMTGACREVDTNAELDDKE